MMKFFKTLIIVLSGLSAGLYAKSPYDAARSGDLKSLRQYRFEGQDLFIPDERGFIPYELAALHANPDKPESLQQHVEVMLWLKEFQAEKHRYGKATNMLVQAGLNALGYDAGTPDGVMGEHTAKAIRAYQRDNDLAETGRLGPQWLGMFFQDSLKDLQYKLSKLGYDTHGTDGVMGAKTQAAMVKFRQDENLSVPNYPYLDNLLLARVDNLFKQKEKAKKSAIAEKTRQESEHTTRYAQAGLRAMGYRIGKIDGKMGSKTANAIKAFQKRRKLPVTGEVNKATRQAMRLAFTKDTQKKLNALGYRVGKPDGLLGKRSVAAIRKYRKRQGLTETGGIDAAMLSSLQGKYAATESQYKTSERGSTQVRFAQAGLRTLGYHVGVDGKMGRSTQRAIKAFQKRYHLKRTGRVDPRTYAKMRVVFLKETQRKLNALGYRVGKPDGRLGKRSQVAIKKFSRSQRLNTRGLTAELIVAVDNSYDYRGKKTHKSPKTVVTKHRVRTAKPSKTSNRRQPSTYNPPVIPIAATTPVVVSTGSRASGRSSAKGRMTFNRSGGRVVGCSLAGRRIPIEWCEPFYPLPRNNHCEATFKPSNGSVLNLWCK